MVDPLTEFQVILGVLFWLGLHTLIDHVWCGHHPQCRHRRRGQKAKYPPLPGLLEKPHCEHCAADSASPVVPVPEPPPLMSSRRGRPRRVKTKGHYCPNKGCRYYGWLNRGNIRANGRPNGRDWRQLHCRACGHYFLETHGTVFYGKQQAPETILYVIGSLAEGTGLRATARIFALEAKTVLSWLIAAAEQSTAVSTYLLHDLNVSQVQLDELFALVAEWRTQPPTEDQAEQALKRLPRHPRWVWTATDPMSKRLFYGSVGERSLAQAQTVIHQAMQCLAQGSVPLFLSDGLSYYRTAILTHFGQWWQPPRRSTRGSAPKPRWCPMPSLQYAQVVKKCRRRKLVQLIQRVIFGSQETIKARLDQYGVLRSVTEWIGSNDVVDAIAYWHLTLLPSTEPYEQRLRRPAHKRVAKPVAASAEYDAHKDLPTRQCVPRRYVVDNWTDHKKSVALAPSIEPTRRTRANRPRFAGSGFECVNSVAGIVDNVLLTISSVTSHTAAGCSDANAALERYWGPGKQNLRSLNEKPWLELRSTDLTHSNLTILCFSKSAEEPKNGPLSAINIDPPERGYWDQIDGGFILCLSR